MAFQQDAFQNDIEHAIAGFQVAIVLADAINLELDPRSFDLLLSPRSFDRELDARSFDILLPRDRELP